MAIGSNIDYSTRKIVDFVPGDQSTVSVTLNTGEVMVPNSEIPVVEDNKTVTVTTNGETIVNPTSGKDAMKKVTVTVNVPSPYFAAYKNEDDLIYVKSNDTEKTTAYTNFTTTVTVEYDSTNDKIEYDEKTWTRSSNDDIKFD